MNENILNVNTGSLDTESSSIAGDFANAIEEAFARRAQAMSAAQQPVAQQPVAQQPVAQQPVAQQPVAQQPVAQQPVAQQPVAQPVVSTARVGDVSGMFLDKQASAPESQMQGQPLPPEAPVQEPENLTDKAKYAWQEIRAREKASRQLAEQYKAELDRVMKESNQVVQERVKFTDELKAKDDRIAQLEEKLGRLDLSMAPEFRERYDKPLDDVYDRFQDALHDAADIDDPKVLEQTVDRMLNADDSSFQRLISQLPSAAQGSLWDKRREFRSLMTARDQAIDEWRTSQAGLAELDDQTQIVKRSQRRHDMAEAAIDFTKNRTPPENRLSVLSESTYADDIANVDSSFRGFMQQAKEDEIARAAYQGFLMPVVQRQLAFMQQALEEWRGAFYQLRGAGSPPTLPMRVSTPDPQVVAPPPPRIVEGSNFRDTVEATVASSFRKYGFQ